MDKYNRCVLVGVVSNLFNSYFYIQQKIKIDIN
jgi:hypothetical protein